MDAQALRSLPRVELQQLAKNNRIKANAKSATIIDKLLKLFPAGVPRATTPTPRRPRRSSVEQREGVLPVIKPETPAARTRSAHRKPHVPTPAQARTSPAEAHAPPSQPQATPAQVVASPIEAHTTPTKVHASPTKVHASPTESLTPPIPAHIFPTLAKPSFKRPQASAPPPPATLPRASTSRQQQKMDETIFPLRHSDFTPFAYTTPRPGRGIPVEPQSDHSPVYTPQDPLPSAFHATDELQPGLLSPFTTPRARVASASTEPPVPHETRFGKPFPVDKEEAANHATSIRALLEQIGDQAARVPDLQARHAFLKKSIREQRRQLKEEKALRIQLDALLAYAPLVEPGPEAHEKGTDAVHIEDYPVERQTPKEEELNEDAPPDQRQRDENNKEPGERDSQSKEEPIPNEPLDQAQKEEAEDEWSKRVLRRARSPLSSVKRKLAAERGKPLPEPPRNPFTRAPPDPRDSVTDTPNHPPSPPRTPPRSVQTPEEVAELMLEVREEVTEEHAVARALEAGLFASEPEPSSPRYMEDFDGEVRRRTLHRLSQGAAPPSSSPL